MSVQSVDTSSRVVTRMDNIPCCAQGACCCGKTGPYQGCDCDHTQARFYQDGYNVITNVRYKNYYDKNGNFLFSQVDLNHTK